MIMLVAFVAATVVLTFSLTSLVSGTSKREILALTASRSIHMVVEDPLYAPVKAVQGISGLISAYPLLFARLPSVVFALLTLAAIVYVLRRWYGPRTATYGFVIFASSAWFLHVGRLATFDIMHLWAVPALLASHILLRDNTDRRAAAWAWLCIQFVLLYIPGMVWFVALNALWQRRDIAETWSLANIKLRTGWTISSLVIIAPLLYSIVTNFSASRLMAVLALPATIPQPMDVVSRLADGLLFVSIRGTAPNDIWLNNLPVLDAFLSVALLVGIYFYAKHWRASRTQLIGSFLLLGLILFALGAVPYSIIVPLLYIIAAAGIAYLLYIWLRVFPRNPIARGFGMGLIAIAVVLSSIYSLRQYFVAWPHHPETHQVFADREIPRTGR